MATDAEAGISEHLRQRQFDVSYTRKPDMPRRFKQSNAFDTAAPIPRRVNR